MNTSRGPSGAAKAAQKEQLSRIATAAASAFPRSGAVKCVQVAGIMAQTPPASHVERS